MSTRLGPDRLDLVSTRIADLIGLHYPLARTTDLERGLRQAASAAGFRSSEQLATAILSGEITDEQLDALAERLTVQETYFFRHPQAFAALEQVVLPERMRCNANTGVVNIWSAGCSNGAEPYSLSITCSLAQSPAGDFRFNILGTDLNRRALAQARTAIYPKSALRETPLSLVARYFHSHGADKFELRDRYRRSVTLAHGNLVGPPGSEPWSPPKFDVIFCRNVIMYFSPEQRATAATRLADSLAVGGYLFVSPCEVVEGLYGELAVREICGSFAYQKTGGARASQPNRVTIIQPRPKPEHEAPNSPAVRRGRRTTPKVLPNSVATSPSAQQRETLGTIELLAQTQTLANEGQAAAALAMCESIAQDMALSPSYHFLHASILQELQRRDEASAALKRALYLDADFVMAHFMLGSLELRDGRVGPARKHFAATLGILETLPADAILPASEGITAAQLMELLS